MQLLPIKIRGAEHADIAFLKEKIAEFRLDDVEFNVCQFLVAENNSNEKVGFGRIREFDNCAELCTLGVVAPYRLQGVGTHVAEALIAKTKKPLYLVCIIPEFFIPLGFNIEEKYPPQLSDKLHRCETQLRVPEKYVVMKFTHK